MARDYAIWHSMARSNWQNWVQELFSQLLLWNFRIYILQLLLFFNANKSDNLIKRGKFLQGAIFI